VSTDEQTTENQRLELEGVAKARGWQIVGSYDDNSVSGAKGREHRREFDRLLKDATRGRFDMVAAWSVDRLGRSLRDLVAFLDEIHSAGVELYLHRQALDTSSPSGRALFGMLGVFAEFERSMIVERVRAGMTRARAKGKHMGRPTIAAATRTAIAAGAKAELSGRAIAKQAGVSEATVRRVLASDRSIEATV
jgi:DNA invertase Pin-like site-specific DNA recombinase